MTNRVFILGAADPEMREIERVLTEQGLPFAYALHGRQRVTAPRAYVANATSVPVPRDAEVVFIECRVAYLACASEVVVDHHRQGDPGFGLPPERYMEGSSLGQLLRLLELEPTQAQRVICAADHCLNHAYGNKCPGVSREELVEFRTASRSANRGVSREQIAQEVEIARLALVAAEKVDILGTQVAWIDNVELLPEIADASAMYGIPYMYRKLERDGRVKMGILGAAAPIISAWMGATRNTLANLYGDPVRGYAGGYNVAL